MRARLIRDYRSQYHDPVRFARGETVTLGARDTQWPEFLWATDAGGRSGWVHQDFVAGDSGEVLAARDYSARELDADEGARVRLLERAGGWWWVENERGEQGWLPENDLSIEQERGDA